MMIGFVVIVLLGYIIADRHAINTAQAEAQKVEAEDLRRTQEELTAWKLAATEAIARLDTQERLQYGKRVPGTIVGFYGTLLGTYGDDLAPGRYGNLYYDATPGGLADHLFCMTYAEDGHLSSITYRGQPTDQTQLSPLCATP